MRIDNEAEQLSIYDLDLWCGKMCPEPSPAEHQKERISGSSSRRSSELKSVVFQSLDLTPGAGNLLGEFYWELISPWRGDALTLNTGVSPRAARGSSLWRILEPHPHRRYFLSRKACLGILRRARRRGKVLPDTLREALELQSGLRMADLVTLLRLGLLKTYHINQRDEGIDLGKTAGAPVAFAANQRDEVRDLGDKAGALGAQPGMKQQTFVASFSAGAGATAGGIGYSEEVTPTLKGSAGGNSMPSVLCINDQGGQVMELSEDMTGTLRAQEHGHQPLVFENHGIDARYNQVGDVAPTMSARYGTGGNNVPLVEEPIYCITGNAIDRKPENGGNGIGYQENVMYTLNTMDRHAVCYSTDDLYTCEPAGDKDLPFLLIRRLTPLECERLQGFPDGWTDVPGASDSARYKALGNSVAIPCVDFVMKCMADTIRESEGMG